MAWPVGCAFLLRKGVQRMAIIKYSGGGKPGGTVTESVSTDGGKTFNTTGNSNSGYQYGTNSGGQVVNSNTGQRPPTFTGGGNSGAVQQPTQSGGGGALDTIWNNYNGATGKQYSVAGSNGTIKVTQKDGTYRYVRPGDDDFNMTYNNMVSDLKGNGIDYTPTHQVMSSDGKVTTTKDYTAGNSALQYALQQAIKQQGGGTVGTADYVKSLYNRIGTQRENGSIVTMQDINNELNRLGLSDYNSDNAILTVGGTVLPGNQFVTQHTGADGSNSADSRWVTYGGQDYLLGGDSANWAQYVNGKTGKLSGIDYVFGNLNNNPYAMQDPDFLNAYNAMRNQYQQAIGGAGPAGNGSYTGNANVDNVINLINSQNSYAQATGGAGATGGDILAQIEAMLGSGKDAYAEFIAGQKQQAQDAATAQSRQAWVNSQLAADRMNEALSAQGLGTSGAVQQGQVSIQNDYSNNLGKINSNLQQALTGLSGQELQLLSDYYNNMANYTYQYNDAEANRAIQREQLALSQQQAEWERQYQQQQLAMQQAAWDQQLKEYADAKKQKQAEQYQLAYEQGNLSEQGYINAMAGLGMMEGGYFANGSASTGLTQGQLGRQQAQLELELLKAQLEGQLLTNSKKKQSSSGRKSGGGSNSDYGIDESAVNSSGTPMTAQQQKNYLNLYANLNPINPLAQMGTDIKNQLGW